MIYNSLSWFLRQNITSLSRAHRLISTIKFAEDVQLPKLPDTDYLSDKMLILRAVLDDADARYTDNTRIIAVEGNIACGKSFLASQLAKLFGMIHIPDATEDDIYVYRDVKPAFDLRVHNALLPKSAKYYTCEMFWTEPDLLRNGKPLYLQYQFFLRRLFNYSKALSTVLNTGRGVVLDRSPFSELAFNDALFECGHISERGHRWFNQNHGNICVETYRPHLIVFIKNTTEQIRERIKKRNIPWEVNGVNLSDKFLDTYARLLEKNYLIPMSAHSEILVVDGTTTDVFNEDDCRVIANRITEIDLSGDRLLRDDQKFYLWRRRMARYLGRLQVRTNVSDAKFTYNDYVREIDIPMDLRELCYANVDRDMQLQVMEMDPRTTYAPLYNPYYSSLFDIMFNPFLAKRNYRSDLPKQYLWP